MHKTFNAQYQYLSILPRVSFKYSFQVRYSFYDINVHSFLILNAVWPIFYFLEQFLLSNFIEDVTSAIIHSE